MGNRVMCPCIFWLNLYSVARAGFGLSELMTLLIPKCDHTMDVGFMRRIRQSFEASAQHGRGVACIEVQVLGKFDDHQIAWVLIAMSFAHLHGFRHITRRPCRGDHQGGAFARV